MAPPPIAPPPVTNTFDTPEYDAQQLRAQHASAEHQTELLARDCLEEILHRFNLVIHEHQAHKRTLVQAVDSCLTTCLEVLEMQYPAREDNPVSVISLEHSSWEQEKPPDPCTFDSWLRSALPDTVPTAASTSNRGDSWVMQQFLQKQPSMHRSASIRSTGSGAGDPDAPPASQRNASLIHATGAAGHQRPREGVSSGSARSLHTLNSRRHVTKLDTRKQLTPEQEHLEEQLRTELQQRKTQEDMSRRLELKDAEERSKLASLRKELKGKDYTYDHKGEVVILNEFDPDRTPLEALSGPGFKVAAPEENSRMISPKRRNTLRSMSMRSAATDAAAAAAAATARNTMSPTEMRRERDRRLANDYKKMAPKTQPSAMETLLPAGGVTLRGAGGATKSGPLRQPAAGGITREAYAKQVAKRALQAQAEAAGQAYPPVTPLGIPASSTHPPRDAPISNRGGAAAGGGGGGGAAAVGSRSGHGTAAAVAAARAALQAERAADPLAAYGDNRYDPFTNSRSRRSRTQASQPDVAPPPPLAGSDINLSLTTAGDWGSAGLGRAYELPPSLPHSKPTEKQLAETVGRTERLPRERAPLPTLAPPLSPSKAGAAKAADRLQFHSILAE